MISLLACYRNNNLADFVEMNLDNRVMEQWRLESLAKRLPDDLSEYLEPGYDAVAVHSSSILLKANPAAAAMFGYRPAELFGMNSWMLFAPRSADDLMQRLMTKSQEPYRVYARHRDGSEFLVELKGRELELDDEPVRVVQLRKIPE